MRIDGLIFDFDGTIADSMWVWDIVDQRFLEKRNIPYTREYVEMIAVLGFEDGADFVIETFGLDETQEDIIEEWKATAEGMYATEVELKPACKDWLLSLHEAGWPMAIATSLQRPILEPSLKNNGVFELFNPILSCDELTPHGKSTPIVYQEASRLLGIEPQHLLVFEDVAKCAAVAKAAGFNVVGVRDEHKQQKYDELVAAADFMLESYAEDPALLQKILAA